MALSQRFGLRTPVMAALVTLAIATNCLGQDSEPRPNPLPQLVDDLVQDTDVEKKTNAYYVLHRVAIDDTWNIDPLRELANSDQGHLRNIAFAILERIPSAHSKRAVGILRDRLEVETQNITRSTVLRALHKHGQISATEAAQQINQIFVEELETHLERAQSGDDFREFAIRLFDIVATNLFELNDTRNGVRIWLVARRLSEGKRKSLNVRLDTSKLPDRAAIELARVARDKSNASHGLAIRALAQFGFTNKSIQSNLLSLLSPTELPLKQNATEQTLSEMNPPYSSAKLRTVAIDALGHLAFDRASAINALQPMVAGKSGDSLVAACSLARLGDNSGLPLLTQALREAQPERAIVLLGIIGHLRARGISALEPVSSLAASDEDPVVWATELCLARLAQSNPTALLKTFDHGNDKIKSAVCGAFESMQRPPNELVQGLLDRFEKSSQRIRIAITECLIEGGKFPDSRLPALLKLTHSEDSEIRQLSMFTLSFHNDLPPFVLRDISESLDNEKDTAIAEFAHLVLAAQDSLPLAVRNRVRDLIESGNQQTMRQGLAHHFVDTGDSRIVLKLLQTDDRRVRPNALVSLRKRKTTLPPAVLDATHNATRDSDAIVRMNAARLLMHVEPESEKTTSVILRLLNDPTGGFLSVWTPEYLLKQLADSQPGNAAYKRQALRYLADSDNRIRVAAARFILASDPANQSAKEVIRSSLRSSTADEKNSALDAIGLLPAGDVRVRGLVRLLLEDPDRLVQRQAWKAWQSSVNRSK